MLNMYFIIFDAFSQHDCIVVYRLRFIMIYTMCFPIRKHFFVLPVQIVVMTMFVIVYVRNNQEVYWPMNN